MLFLNCCFFLKVDYMNLKEFTHNFEVHNLSTNIAVIAKTYSQVDILIRTKTRVTSLS